MMGRALKELQQVHPHNNATKDNNAKSEAATPSTAVPTEEEDCALVEKLRWANWDQYQTLVRMHLSFALDLATDEWDCSSSGGKSESRQAKRVLTPFSSKKGSNAGGGSGGCGGAAGGGRGVNLTQEGVCQAYQLIEFLSREDNLKTEGLFRRCGRLARQQQLKTLLNSGSTLNLDALEFTVHEVACVLKGFLAELPEPLLTEAHYSVHCQIAELGTSSDASAHSPPREDSTHRRQVRSLQLLFLLLPPSNLQLLRDLLSLLHRVASFSHTNRMSALNLATMFAPHLLHPRRLPIETVQQKASLLTRAVCFMVENATSLFGIPLELALDVRAYWAGQQQKEGNNGEASTVFSFVDRAKTAEVSAGSSTEVALAELYAYVQALPESGRKRRLVRQFNKENGVGTPALLHRGVGETTSSSTAEDAQGGSGIEARRRVRSRSFGESIKRHLFSRHKHKTGSGTSSSAHYTLHRAASDDNILTPTEPCSPPPAKLKLFQKSAESLDCDPDPPRYSASAALVDDPPVAIKGPRCLSDSALCCHDDDYAPSPTSSTSSEPASSSSGNSAPYQCNCGRTRMLGMLSCILPRCRQLGNHSHPVASSAVVAKSNLHAAERCLTPPTETATNSQVVLTPAATAATPETASNANTSLVLSPLTRSAQRMPRMLQESILTPRNRRPLVLMSSSDLPTPPTPTSILGGVGGGVGMCQTPLGSRLHPGAGDTKACGDGAEEPFSDKFRRYLLARHMSPLIPATTGASPSSPMSSGIDEDDSGVGAEGMSDSMLYFLDGNLDQGEGGGEGAEG